MDLYVQGWGEVEDRLQAKVASVPFTTVMAGLGVAVSALLGSLYTAQAVMSGDPTATFVRFVGAIALGGYYLALLNLGRSPRRQRR